MESQRPTYDFMEPFPSERDGPLETFLREQITANANIIYNSYDGSGAPGRDFFVVIASADRWMTQADKQVKVTGYKALLMERWWEWQDDDMVAKTLRRRVLKASLDRCSAPAEALMGLSEAVFKETGDWLCGGEQEDLRQQIEELDEEDDAR